MGEVLAQQLHAIFWVNFLWLWLPVLSSARLFIQPNSITSPKTVWLMVSHSPTLLPSPGVSLLPNFSGAVPASDQAGEYPVLSVSHSILSLPVTSSIQVYPRRDWLLCSGRGGSCKVRIADLAILQSSYCSRDKDCSHLAVVPGAGPGNLPIYLQNFLIFHFLTSSAIFDFQTSYTLGFHLLFTLFFRRLVMCPSWVHKQVG